MVSNMNMPRYLLESNRNVSFCFEVGRFTLTQSSWTASTRRRSRKWMSGHAAIALVLLRDRGQFATLTICPLGEPVPPSQGESPFPVDFYLSWMSPVRPSVPRPSPGCRIGRLERRAWLHFLVVQCEPENKTRDGRLRKGRTFYYDGNLVSIVWYREPAVARRFQGCAVSI